MAAHFKLLDKLAGLSCCSNQVIAYNFILHILQYLSDKYNEVVDLVVNSAKYVLTHSCAGHEVERTDRTDFLQRRHAAQKKDQMEDFKTNNGILLRNLLPGHVAEHFMGSHKIVRVSLCSSTLSF